MRLLDRTFPTPELNLACDEALLDECEGGVGGETLRFWESDQPFVVLGHGNRVRLELNVEACEALGVPILRRCTGGGTVLQGPGCLNYAVILRIGLAPDLQSVTGTNTFVMERHRAALASILGKPIAVQGITDLTVDGRKFSGNAQRRRSHSLLFHGTFLLGLDLERMERLLPRPSRQPDYRAGRPHRDFLTALGLPAEDLKSALAAAWGAQAPPGRAPIARMEQLVRDRYSAAAWTHKF
jgi:lipoate---protein ligase